MQQDTEKDTSSRPLTPGQRLAARKAARAARKAADRGTVPVMTSKFGELAARSSEWLAAHQREIWITVAAGVLLAAGGTTWWMLTRQTEQQAGDALRQAVNTSQAPVLDEDSALDAADVEISFASESERTDQALERYRQVAEQHPDTPAADWARLGEAHTLLGAEKHAEAEQAYREVLEGAEVSSFVRAMALEGLVFSLEAREAYDKAEQPLQQLSQVDGGYYAALADYHRGRLQLAGGQREQAIAHWKGLLEVSDVKDDATEPGNALRTWAQDQARVRLRELGEDVAEAPPAGGGLDMEAIKQLVEETSKNAPAGEGDEGAAP